MGLSDTLKKLDIFGGQRGLTFSGDEKHKTVVGAFLTVIYLLLVIFFFILYIDEFTSRFENPVVDTKKLVTQTSPHLDFDKNNFFFSFSLKYKGEYVKPSELQKILDVSVKQYTTQFNTQSIIEPKSELQELKPCDETHFTIKEKMIITNPTNSPATSAICVSGNKSLKIDGEFYTTNKSYVNIEIKPCSNDQCRSDLSTIIESEQLEIIMGLIIVSINPKDIDNPYKYHYDSNREFSLFNSKTYIRKLFFQKSEIQSDTGFLNTFFENKTSMNFKQEMNQDKDRVQATEPYIVLNLYSSNDIFKISRNYQKFQDLVAKIGGILSVLSLVFVAAYGFYNQTSLKIDIMNSILIRDKKEKMNFCSVLKFIFVKILSGLGCSGCFSRRTHELCTMYFNAEERIKDYLEVKAIVNNTRDVRLFRRIFFNKYQTHLLSKIENDTLLVETDHHYLDEEIVKIKDDEINRYLNENSNPDDDVDRKINTFFHKLRSRITRENEKKDLEEKLKNKEKEDKKNKKNKKKDKKDEKKDEKDEKKSTDPEKESLPLSRNASASKEETDEKAKKNSGSKGTDKLSAGGKGKL